MRSYFFHDQRADIYWKGALISQVIVLGVGVAIKVIGGLVPLPTLSVDTSLIQPAGINATLPIFGSGGIPESIISLILGIGTKIIQSLYNGFIKQLVQFAIVLSSYFLASNLPYDIVFGKLGVWIFVAVSTVFLIMLIFRVIAYALSITGGGNPEKEKADIVNLLTHYFMSFFLLYL